MLWKWRRALTLRVVSVLLPLLITLAAHAQGGPPFRTDDPETPGNRHWEINFGWIGDRNPGAGNYQVPDFDFNYGLGDRVQLKFEIPITIEEIRPQAVANGSSAVAGHVLGGLGNSQMGIKWRFYEHHSGETWWCGRWGTGLLTAFKRQKKAGSAEGEAPKVDLSVSTFPTLWVENPTRSVPRGVVASGPDFQVPLEMNMRLGPVRVDVEGGYNFGNVNVPQSWFRGILVGHEFSESNEEYVELYDQQDANRLPEGRGVGAYATGGPKQRQATLGVGGRQAINKARTINFMWMGGRSFQKVTADNAQPSWIAYVGFQVLLGPKE